MQVPIPVLCELRQAAVLSLAPVSSLLRLIPVMKDMGFSPGSAMSPVDSPGLSECQCSYLVKQDYIFSSDWDKNVIWKLKGQRTAKGLHPRSTF